MTKQMTDAQRAYEAKRAAKAGMSLDKWLDHKEKDKQAEVRAREKSARPPEPLLKKPGLFSRLLEKAQKPL
jgi:capsid protein